MKRISASFLPENTYIGSIFLGTTLLSAAFSVQAMTDAQEDHQQATMIEISQRDPINVDLGVTYTSGSFPEAVSSTTVEKAVSVQWSLYDTDFQFTTSYLNRTAPAGTIRTRINKQIVFVPRLVSSTGTGDVFISANREVFSDAATAIALNLIASMKIATADSSKGLGTGKNDYFLGASASYPFEKVLLSGGAKYSALGSPGRIRINGILENIRLQNVWSGYLTLSSELTSKLSAAITYTVEQPSIADASFYQMTEISSSYRINDLGGVRIYGSKGANQNTPNWSAGIGIFSSF